MFARMRLNICVLYLLFCCEWSAEISLMKTDTMWAPVTTAWLKQTSGWNLNLALPKPAPIKDLKQFPATLEMSCAVY